MRENLQFTLEDNKHGIRLLTIEPAIKGFLIKIDDVIRFNGITFSLPEINQRLQNWIDWGVVVNYTSSLKKPKCFTSIKDTEERQPAQGLFPDILKKKKRKKRRKKRVIK